MKGLKESDFFKTADAPEFDASSAAEKTMNDEHATSCACACGKCSIALTPRYAQINFKSMADVISLSGDCYVA
jgi:hypothetical protein